MFVTRATRHDRADVEELYEGHGWGGRHDLKRGTAFIARDGGVVGVLRLVEAEPNTLVVDGVLVKESHREKGVGRGLMQTAMNSRGGTMYLCCAEERRRFYEHFGFEYIEFMDAPEPVRKYWEEIGDWPIQPGHDHFFMKAR